MKKLLYILFFLLVGLTAIAQETPPSGLKAINAQFYIHLPDSTIWQQKGTPYNWHRVAKYSELQAMGLLYLLKSDSTHYTTRSYFGLNGMKYSDTAAFKKKIDSVSNSGYTTHGYFNKYGLRWIDTVGDIATKYYATHGATNFYGDKILYGGLTANGVSVLKLADNSIGISVQKADLSEYTGMAINSFSVNDNTGYSSFMRSLITYKNTTGAELNIQAPDNSSMSGTNSISWPLNKTGTVALTSDIPGGGAGGTIVNSFNGSTGAVVFNSVAYVSTISDLQSYSGSQLTVSVGNLVRGGIFDYTTTSYTPDGGTIFAATGKGSGYWIRRYNGIDLYPKWFYTGGTFAPYNPATNTGSDMAAAIQAAIDSKPTGTATVQIPENYRISSPIKLKQSTYLVGRTTLFPYQLSGTDTIKYASQTALWADAGIDCWTTTQDTVTYRNQGIVLEKLGFYSIGDTRTNTGGKLYNNANASAALVKPGLPMIKDCYFSGWKTGVDGKDADSFNLFNTHFSECKTGAIGGVSETYAFRNDFYNIDSLGFSSNGSNDIITQNEFEPGTANGVSLQVGANAKYVTIAQNSFKKNKTAIIVSNLAANGTISIEGDNHFYSYTGDCAIRVDSLSQRVYIRGNKFLSDNNNTVANYFIKAAGVTGLYIDNNEFRRTSGGLIVSPVLAQNCTQLTYNNNSFFGSINNANRPVSATNVTYDNNYSVGKVTYGPVYQNSYQYNTSGEAVNTTTSLFDLYDNTATDNTQLIFRRHSGSASSPGAIAAGTIIAGLVAQPNNGVNATTTRASFVVKSNESIAHSSSATGTVWDWQATAAGTTTLVNAGRLSAKGIFSGGFTDATAWFDAGGSTTQAPFRMRSSVAPTSPNSGDFWNLSGVPQFYTGSVTQSLAFLASPTFTGTPAAPTAAAGTNTTQLANTAHVFAERTNTATLTNKTLTSPQINSPLLNTTSVIGQVWTATNTAGAGGWATASVPNRSHTLFAPTTGGTVNTVVNQDNIINPAGALATLTINLPSSPANNDKVFLTFTQAVTAISYTGGTVVGVPASASLGSQWFLTYDTGTTTWY